MKDKICLGTFEVPVKIELHHLQIEEFRRKVNEFYYGSETIPLDVEVSQELRDAHHRLNSTKIVSVKVNYFSDGIIELL